MRVTLVGVLGDQVEYADLIGTSDKLSRKTKKVTYFPDNQGDGLTMYPRCMMEKDGKVRVRTKLGNTFIFKVSNAPISV